MPSICEIKQEEIAQVAAGLHIDGTVFLGLVGSYTAVFFTYSHIIHRYYSNSRNLPDTTKILKATLPVWGIIAGGCLFGSAVGYTLEKSLEFIGIMGSE
jgi:hypothetical protein